MRLAKVVRCGLTVGVCAMAAWAQPATSDYDRWVKGFANAPDGWFGDDNSGAKVALSAFEGDGEKISRRFTCAVSFAGMISGLIHSGAGSGGGLWGPLSLDDLHRLDTWLAELPDDHRRLPPLARRLVVQEAFAGAVRVRVYDGAEPPEPVLNILRMVGLGYAGWALTFKPNSQWKETESWPWVIIAASADGKQVLSARGDHLDLWDAETRELVRKVELPPNAFAGDLALSPDGRLVVATGGNKLVILDAGTWGVLRLIEKPKSKGSLSHGRFTLDGKYVLAEDDAGVRIFDVATGAEQAGLAGLPKATSAFYPSGDWRHAVIVPQEGGFSLWDLVGGSEVARLNGGKVGQVAFSPDGTRVAVVSEEEKQPGTLFTRRPIRIRVWETTSGALLHEYWPREHEAHHLGGIVWSADGRYLLAESDAGVGVWNAETGRYRAELSGCGNGFSLALLGGAKLVEGCPDGVVRVWDLNAITGKIAAFEAELAAERDR